MVIRYFYSTTFCSEGNVKPPTGWAGVKYWPEAIVNGKDGKCLTAMHTNIIVAEVILDSRLTGHGDVSHT